MYFLNSQLLYLVPVAALVAALLVFINYRRRLRLHRVFGDWQVLSETSKPLSGTRYALRALFAGLSAGLLMLALCRPLVPNGNKMIAEGKVDVVAVVDVSRSMAAMDYEGKPVVMAKQLITDITKKDRKISARKDEESGTRLEMVRAVLLNNMLQALDGNQLGIVSYAGEAFPQAFLTRDMNALNWIIDRGVTITSAPGEGSCMAKALQLALAMFDADSPADHERVLVLFSDGGNDDELPQLWAAADACRKYANLKVIVVAMGNAMPAKIPVSKLAEDDEVAAGLLANGKRWYEVDGKIERSAMDAGLLQAVAKQAGGKFIHLQNVSDLNLLDYLGKNAKTNVPGSQELFPWLLGGALLSFVLTFAITKQWRRRKQS